MEYRTDSMLLTVRTDHIVEITTPKDWTGADNLEQAKQNVALMCQVMKGKGMGTLAYMPSTYIDKEVLEYYNSHESGEIATALLTTSFASKIIGNLVLKLSRSNTSPIKIFTRRDKAEAWLLEQIAKHH